MITFFPEIHTKTISVKLKSKAERAIKQGHPWVFEDNIIKQNKPATSGDVVVVFDQRFNTFLACGLYDEKSPIKIKLLQFYSPSKINASFFEERITIAYNKRLNLLTTKTNSYRFIYGEADGFPGLIADVYHDVLVVKLYSECWIPYMNTIVECLIKKSEVMSVVLRLSRNVSKSITHNKIKDGTLIYGQLKSEIVTFFEHNIKFSANVIYGHKTGYFLDHRENRRVVGQMSKGKSVLDVFSYAGGFSVHALANGANEVTSLDISQQALDTAIFNGKLNTFEGKHKIICRDAFLALQDLIRQNQEYDIVVIDPPSFAKRQNEIEKAKTSYARLVKLGVQLVKKGGVLVLASCSSRISSDVFFNINSRELENSNRRFEVLKTTYHDCDHPVIESFPEGAYLKCRYYSILS